jgi:hypothetical protein
MEHPEQIQHSGRSQAQAAAGELQIHPAVLLVDQAVAPHHLVRHRLAAQATRRHKLHLREITAATRRQMIMAALGAAASVLWAETQRAILAAVADQASLIRSAERQLIIPVAAAVERTMAPSVRPDAVRLARGRQQQSPRPLRLQTLAVGGVVDLLSALIQALMERQARSS